MATRQPSIASLYHTATKKAGLNICDGLNLWLQSALQKLCCQERGIAGLLADRVVLEECMAVSVAAPLPADLLTLSPTASTLDTVQPAAKPLAILLHLLISKMSSVNPSSLPSRMGWPKSFTTWTLSNTTTDMVRSVHLPQGGKNAVMLRFRCKE